MGISEQADKLIESELVLVKHGAKEFLYPHGEFLGAFQTALLDRLESVAATCGGDGVRALKRIGALRGDPDEHGRVLNAALRLLRERGSAVDPADVGERMIVAAFQVAT